MAQVRKFQDGGKTFQIGNHTFNTSNADDKKMLEELVSSPEYGGVAQLIYDTVYDPSYDNSLKVFKTADGRITMEGGLDSINDKHLSRGTQKALSRRANLWNDTFKRKSAREFGNDLDLIVNEINKRKTSTPDTKKTKITGVKDIQGGKWSYNDSGWDANNIENSQMLKQLQLLEDYYNSSEEDRKNKYDVSELDPGALEAWLTWRASNSAFNPEGFKAGAARLADSDPFYSQYKWFGFNASSPEEKQAKLDEETAKKVKTKLNEVGINWKDSEKHFHIGEDGNLYVNDDFATAAGLTGSTGYWFNDDWKNAFSESGTENPYSSLYGKIIWNGRVYDQNDPMLHQALQASKYHENLNLYDAAGANSILRTHWNISDFNTESPFLKTVSDQEAYSPWTYGQNRAFRQIKTNLKTGNVLVEYDSKIEGDPFGRTERKYALLNPDGSFRENVSKEYVATIAKIDPNGELEEEAPTFLSQINNGFYEDFRFNNNPHGIRMFTDPKTGDTWITHPGIGDGQTAYRIPREVREKMTDDMWNSLKASPTKLNAFVSGIAGSNDFSSLSDAANTLRFLDKSKLFGGLSVELLDLIGSASLAKKSNPAQYERSINDFIPAMKTGGVLKFQKGGIKHTEFNSRKFTKGPLPKIDKSNEWTSADTWELSSLIADTAAAITTIIDPTNVAGTAASVIGTGTNFVADIKKDGFDWGDVGRGVLNLALDAGTLIPIVGDGIAVGRAAKVAEKLVPLIMKGVKAGAITGITQGGIQLLNKLKSGESLTKDDWRAALNLVNGITTLKNVGIRKAPTTTKATTGFAQMKSKDGTKQITLSDDALKRIKDASVDTRMAKTKEEVIAAHRSAYPDTPTPTAAPDGSVPTTTRLTDEQILDLYDIPTTKEAFHWYSPWKRGVVPDLKATKTNETSVDINKINEGRSSLSKWWHGTGERQLAYQRQLRGEQNYKEGKFTVEQVKKKKLTPVDVLDTKLPSTAAMVDKDFAKSLPKEVIIPGNLPVKGLEQKVLVDVKKLKDAQVAELRQKGHENAAKATEELDYETFIANSPNLQKVPDISSLDTLPPKSKIKAIAPVKYRVQGYNMSPIFTTPSEPVEEGPRYLAPDQYLPYLKKGGVLKGENGLSSFSVQLKDKKSDLNKYLQKSSALGHLHYLAQQGEVWNQYRDEVKAYDELANILSKRKTFVPQMQHSRFMDTRSDKIDELGAQYLTNANQIQTADSGVNASARINALSNWSQLMSDKINQEAEGFKTNQIANDQARATHNLQVAQGLTADQEAAVNAATMKVKGDLDAKSKLRLNLRNNTDNKIAEIRKIWNAKGTWDATNQSKIMQLMEAKAKTTDKDVIAQYDNMINMLRNPEYRSTALGAVGIAKKGGKLRSTTDQMLLDKQKLVAKAIAKINDNTMKILLKAMS